jgi:hypothetical protein
MNTAFDILVIILSTFLAVFLILAIVATVAIIKLVRSVNRVVAKGEHMITSAEHAADIFKNAAVPLSTVRVVTNIIETLTKHKKGNE